MGRADGPLKCGLGTLASRRSGESGRPGPARKDARTQGRKDAIPAWASIRSVKVFSASEGSETSYRKYDHLQSFPPSF